MVWMEAQQSKAFLDFSHSRWNNQECNHWSSLERCSRTMIQMPPPPTHWCWSRPGVTGPESMSLCPRWTAALLAKYGEPAFSPPTSWTGAGETRNWSNEEQEQRATAGALAWNTASILLFSSPLLWSWLVGTSHSPCNQNIVSQLSSFGFTRSHFNLFKRFTFNLST